MKKIFVTVAVALVALNATMAGNRDHSTNLVNEQVALEQTVNEQTSVTDDAFSQDDPYKEFAIKQDENDKHILRFYDIDRIVIKNNGKALIRIYNDKWQLIEQTNGDVDRQVADGNYFVTSSAKLKGSYRH